MNTETQEKRPTTAIVFGGRSPIALSCAARLAEEKHVFLVTRRIDKGLKSEVAGNPRVTLVEANLAREGAADSTIERIYDGGFEPNALAFLQRYRPAGEPSFEEHSRVELWSIAESLEAIARLKSPSTAVKVVVSSSPAAQTVLDDQDAAYHVVKAGQEALVRFYGAKLQGQGVCVNAIRIGSLVIKPRAQKYWDSIPQVLSGLSALSPAGHVLTSTEVGAHLAGLLSPGFAAFSGQILTIDAGYSLLDGAQLARLALDMGHLGHA